MNPTIASTFQALEDAEITWCLLRGEDDLDTPADVDLLVARGDLERIDSVLRPLGFTRLHAHGHGPHRFFVLADAAGSGRVKLDIVAELRFGPHFSLETRAEAECLARRSGSGPVALPAPEDAFWALLFHCLLDKRAVSAAHASALHRLSANAGIEGPLGRLAAAALPPGSTPSGRDARWMVERARRGETADLLRIAPLLESRWPRKRRAARLEHGLGRARRRAERLAAGRSRSGLSVALLAPDGAGKTTLAAALVEALEVPVRVVYMGAYQRPGGGPVRQRHIPGLGLARRILVLWTRWLRGWLHRREGGVVVYDRYTYDSRLPPRGRASHGRRLRRWLLGHAYPAPDLVLVLDAPAEVLHARKPEHPIADLAEQRRRYLELAERLEGAAVVDASQQRDEVLADALLLIGQALASRAPGI